MAETLQQLAASMKDCKGCRLCEERRSVVFGAGPADARVMLIGEGPGQNEDEQGLPFVGRAGQLLDRMLDAVDLSRERNVYIANMVKCRPPKNRDPQPDETEACIGFLREQVRLIRPKIIVCLGRIARPAAHLARFQGDPAAWGILHEKRHSDDGDAAILPLCCGIPPRSPPPLRTFWPSGQRFSRFVPRPIHRQKRRNLRYDPY